MTNFLKDILRQPAELRRCLDRLAGADNARVEEAAAALRGAGNIYLTGIGSSWHAAINVASLFQRRGLPVAMQDAAELLHFTRFAPDSVVLVLSRSGKSAEIVGLLSKARHEGATVIGLTNSYDGLLAREANIPICVPLALDHGISVNTYSSLALAAGVVAETTVHCFNSEVVAGLSHALAGAGTALSQWREQVEESRWLEPGASYYFLGRGSSLGSCYEARLLWEEGVKSAASAMGTGAFRHGPQEMVAVGSRFGVWIDAREMREQDIAVARDLRKLGAQVMTIGTDLPADSGDLVFEVPGTPYGWQFLIDIVPAQLASERLARISGVDCDSFRTCSYIIEDEHGLLAGEAAAPGELK